MAETESPSEAARHAPDTDTDWFLENLVEMVTKTNAEFGITISVNGTLISGLLCSGAKFFPHFGAAFGGAMADKEVGRDVSEAYASYSKIYEPREGEEMPKPAFIHLKNAHFFSSSTQLPAGKGVFWRGRLSSVDGFFIGVFEPSGR